MRKIVVIFLVFLFITAPALAETPYFWISGFKYYPLIEICEEKGIYYEWDPVGRTVTLSKDGVEAKLRVGSDRALIDGEGIRDIGPSVYFYNETVAIPSSFINSMANGAFKSRKKKDIVRYQESYEQAPSGYMIQTIVIDPGHGGKDPGATSRRLKMEEKDINLDMAKRLRTQLAANGIDAYLTRERDIFISLEQRAAIANEKEADLFICLHSNASTNKELCGLEVYYLSEKKVDDSARALKAAKNSLPLCEGSFAERTSTDAKAIVYDLMFTENRVDSKRLAQCVIDSARRKGIHTRWNSLKDANFHVLRNFKTEMPAVLVEIGYLSNRKEEDLISTSEYRQKLVDVIINGIVSYRKEYERQGGFAR